MISSSVYQITTANKNVSLKVTADNGTYAWASTNVFSYTEPTEPETPDTPDEDTPPALSGSDIVKYYGNVIRLSGQVASSYAGQKLMLVIVPKASYKDPASIKYIDECTIGSDGKYSIKFMADRVSSDDFVMTKIQGENVTNSVIEMKHKI